MLFTPAWTPEARKQYDTLRDAALAARAAREGKGKTKSSQQEGLFKQVAKALKLLLTNPKHPGLQTHPYDAFDPPENCSKVFEAYAQNHTPGAYRIFWCYGPGKERIIIISITSHPNKKK